MHCGSVTFRESGLERPVCLLALCLCQCLSYLGETLLEIAERATGVHHGSGSFHLLPIERFQNFLRAGHAGSHSLAFLLEGEEIGGELLFVRTHRLQLSFQELVPSEPHGWRGAYSEPLLFS